MLSDKFSRVAGISVIAGALALAVIGWFTLPDTLVMQLTAGGEQGNTLPKALGLLVSFAVSGVFAVAQMKCARGERLKYFLVSLLGIVMFAFTFIVNA